MDLLTVGICLLAWWTFVGLVVLIRKGMHGNISRDLDDFQGIGETQVTQDWNRRFPYDPQ